MNKSLKVSALIIFLCASFFTGGYAQEIMHASLPPASGSSLRMANTAPAQNTSLVTHAKNGMTAMPNNYSAFSIPNKNVSPEVLAANKGYEHHPELGMLFAETPCDDCYELVGKRTEISKTFVKKGTNGRDILQQTSSAPMHYKDAQGNWLTIKTKFELDNAHRGVYAAYEQPCPVSINTNAGGAATVGLAGESITFNNNLQLVYAKPDGSEMLLGNANWSKYTAGDDGIYVKDAWPGVDIEIFAFRGGIKTNYVITHALPAYAGGRLLVRDHFAMANGLHMHLGDMTNTAKDKMMAALPVSHTGLIMIENAAGEDKYVIAEANVYEKHNAAATYQKLSYSVSGNTLDIVLPGNFLDRDKTAYPVIIDPLVSNSTTLALPPNGSTYTSTLAGRGGCMYTNPATTPANVTVTDVQFAVQYTAANGASLSQGLMEFYINGCRSPGAAAGFGGLWWYCNVPGGGTCTANGGSSYSIWSDVASCIPAPQCTPYNLNMQLYLSQTANSTAGPCTSNYIFLTQPFIVTVLGHTVEVGGSGGVTATPATVCAGSSSSLSVSGVYGVPPYTISWAPGSLSGSPVTVTPPNTTTYTATITDACGIMATASKQVTVNPIAPITGPTSVCAGTTITLSNAITPGTWSSNTPGIATVTTNTGIVGGISAGAAIIKYTTSAGCSNTATISVTPLPGAITGNTTLCLGSTSTLHNGTPGGAWSSSNSSVATITPSSAVVSGIGSGVSTITYSFGGACYVTTGVTVNPLAPITGNTTICQGATTVLSDIVSGGTWSSSSPAVATIDANANVQGLIGGTTTITYFTPQGCSATAVLTVNALPTITNVTFTDPTTCQGADGTITLDGLTGGPDYAVDYTFGTASVPTTTITASGSQVVIPGLVQGAYSVIYVTDAITGCVSNLAGPVKLSDPLPPPPAIITSNVPVCVGQTLALKAYDQVAGGTYVWSGPNGFTATQWDPQIPNLTLAATGTYFVTYTVKNCPTTSSADINVYPSVTLNVLTPSQSVPYGTAVHLWVEGALYYTWTPNDGTVDNPNINNPFATPMDSTTYTVIGVNIAGCADTAMITIKPDHSVTEFIPSAFTPNGDGLNDIFRIGNMKFRKLVEFSVYNRWGQRVYHNEYDPKAGWDGSFNGVQQDQGVYNYNIILVNTEGITKNYTGSVMLMR